MEDLFSTNLGINDKNINYRVIFDNEKYVFVCEADQPEFKSFSFRREHDEWVDRDPLPEKIKSQAIDALEKYLLKQH